MCALLLAICPQVRAGFDFPKGKPDNEPNNDGERVGRAETCPQGTLDKLKSTFGLNDADAKMKLNAIRRRSR